MAANSSSRRSYYTGKKRGSSSGSSGLGRIIAIVLVLAVLVACGVIFIPRLVHHCDNCDKLFFGTGYSANIVTNTLSSFHGKDDKILCRECAESDHALEILTGKSLEDFKRPLFGSNGD